MSFASLRSRSAWAGLSCTLALAVAGCSTRPLGCPTNVVSLVVTLDEAAAAADQLVISFTAGGTTQVTQTAHEPGVTTVTLTFRAPEFVNETITFDVRATLAGTTLAEASENEFLDASCASFTLALGAGPSGGDLGPSPPSDLGGFGPAVPLSTTVTNKLDILFMIDNSPSMTAMQAQLQTQFAQFLQPFVDLAALGLYADLHIGVVTSDYGAGDTAGGGCQASPGGQRGLLQTTAAAGTANAGCAGPTGTPYIAYRFGAGGDSSNLPNATNTAQLATTFGCMASVGDTGCGFEHQLESVLQALQNTHENAGFLRDDALLAVVFFTNEDDGSAPPSTKIYESAADVSTFGAYDTYRQTRFGVACVQGGLLALSPEAAATAPLMGCQGAPETLFTGGEYDVQRYINLFTQPPAQGGLKNDPDDVMLVAVDAPETPFQTVTVAAGSGLGLAPNPAYVPCSPIGATCLVRVDHACQNSVAPAFFGDPAVRLNSVVKAAKLQSISSICGAELDQPPDYSQALAKAGDLLRSHLGGNCMPTKLADPTAPDCDVVASGATGATTTLPRCDQGAPPCWSALSAPSCAGSSPDDVAIALTGALPAGTSVTAACR